MISVNSETAARAAAAKLQGAVAGWLNAHSLHAGGGLLAIAHADGRHTFRCACGQSLVLDLVGHVLEFDSAGMQTPTLGSRPAARVVVDHASTAERMKFALLA